MRKFLILAAMCTAMVAQAGVLRTAGKTVKFTAKHGAKVVKGTAKVAKKVLY
jgi:hypothetical protein